MGLLEYIHSWTWNAWLMEKVKNWIKTGECGRATWSATKTLSWLFFGSSGSLRVSGTHRQGCPTLWWIEDSRWVLKVPNTCAPPFVESGQVMSWLLDYYYKGSEKGKKRSSVRCTECQENHITFLDRWSVQNEFWSLHKRPHSEHRVIISNWEKKWSIRKSSTLHVIYRVMLCVIP